MNYFSYIVLFKHIYKNILSINIDLIRKNILVLKKIRIILDLFESMIVIITILTLVKIYNMSNKF
jgi:hypothetical protein